ncbi:hypothetical protein ROA7450_02719 [Roseovarius albus]|uniref:VPLPA-CTERM protein sorting domain protein n=1 Tax=Roseovarius albus TaxID=1247867 RepID=A0A1X6ZK49_9RHOB|nr:VPLPA-CTERM sorting domain-containing protein [Roseovarius albus]SLN53255.1 hypothetical protein ROA7450_02719 [Roseovarius albus]
MGISLKSPIVASAMVCGIACGVQAATIGSAVLGNGSNTTVVGQPTPSGSEQAALLADAAGTSALAADIIGYFIPLGGSNCTFGSSGCGLNADAGFGGLILSMWLKFTNVEGGNSTLNLFFEDLDLAGSNDPQNFFEQVVVHDTSGVEVATFDDVTNSGVSGDTGTQLITSVGLGSLIANDDYWIKLDFSASSQRNGYNTPEFLIAAIDGTPAVIPLPAAGWLLLAGLGGLFGLRRKKAA